VNAHTATADKPAEILEFGAVVASLVTMTARARVLAGMTGRPEDARTWARYDQALRLLLAESPAIMAPDWTEG